MGSFSWLYCDQGDIRLDKDGYPFPKREQQLASYRKNCPASVLFPKEFGGKEAQINVDTYVDYGVFGMEDIYCLVADWNREWISKHPDYKTPYSVKREEAYPECCAKKMSEYSWWPFYSDLSLSKKEVVRKWEEKCGHRCEYRTIGIDIACYDEDNAALPYPIKIAKDPRSVYEDCPPSYSDPYQGCYEDSDCYYHEKSKNRRRKK